MPSRPTRGSSGLSERAFCAMLLVYPTAFRDEYGREMALVFTDRYRDAAGTLARLRLWLEVLAGIVTEAPQEHVRMGILDVRYALRRLRTSPSFAVISIATLALAIGASTAMFSVVNAVLLRPLPYEAPERLVMLWREVPSLGVREGRSGYATVEQWRTESASLADVAVFDPISATLMHAGELEQISVLRASPNLFTLLGVQPVRGRAFSSQEANDRQRVAVISYRFWQARFGGSLDAIGRSVQIDGLPSQIVGILPQSVDHAGFGSDVWEPHTLFSDWEARRTAQGPGAWFALGRLQPHVSFEQAQTELRSLARRLDGQQPAAQTREIGVVPLAHHLTGARPRLVLWMLIGASLLLLLVAATNVAGLSLARGVGRVPEMAIRTALGASRSRIVRLLLAESVTVAVIAGVLGLLLAITATQMIKALGPAKLARLQDVSVDVRVLAWALAVSLVTGVLVGLAPAATTWRRNLRGAAMDGGRGIAGGTATRLRRLFVVAECAAAIVLLAGAGLLVRSWHNVMDVDPGFRPERVLSMSFATPASMANGRRASFYDLMLAETRALPGVERVGISSELFVGNVAGQIVTAEGSDRITPQTMQLRRDEVAGDFFETLGTPLVAGRFFTAADAPGAARVAIVNELMAGRVWPGRDPIGRRVTLGAGANASSFTVVGVVGNMRRQGLEVEPVPQMFESLAQNPSRRAILFVRSSSADPSQLAAPLRAAVRRVDPNTLVYGVGTVDDRLGELVAERRLQTSLLAGFSVVALLLATIGLYGLMQYSVASRTHEIGLRMALGARAGDILRMVVREALVLSLAGLVLGLVGAVWLGRAASTLLFGVTAADPLTFTAVTCLVAVVVMAACYLPARRAMRVAPIVALQQRVM